MKFARMYLPLLLAALALGALVPDPAAAEEGPGDIMALSLQEALLTALQKNFDIQVERVALQGAEENLLGSYGLYDPNLSFDWSAAVYRQPTGSALQAGQASLVSMNRADTYNIGLSQYSPWGQTFSLAWTNQRSRTNSRWALLNPTYDSGLELRTTMPLLKGFGTAVGNIQVIRAKWDRQAAGEQFSYQIRDTLLQVENDYWNLLYASKYLEVAQKALDLAKRFQEETRLKIQAGVLAPIEQISADAQVANREQDIIVAQTQVGNAQDILKLSLGFTKESDEWYRNIRPTEDPKAMGVSDYEEEDLIERALEIRPEVKELVVQVEKAKANTRYAKNQTLPQLDLVAGLIYQGLAGDGTLSTGLFEDQGFPDAWRQVRNFDHKSWMVGLALRYPIANRSARHAYQGTRLQQTAQEILLQKKRLVVANEVRLSLRNVEAAEKRVAAALVTLDLQRQKLDAEEKKFQNGLSTSFQVLSYQNDLLSAATDLLKANLDRVNTMAQLDRSVGTYLESRGIQEAE